MQTVLHVLSDDDDFLHPTLDSSSSHLLHYITRHIFAESYTTCPALILVINTMCCDMIPKEATTPYTGITVVDVESLIVISNECTVCPVNSAT